ncbi:MAG: hypothetical protein ACUVT8_09015 [Armatimonadota bacterium]
MKTHTKSQILALIDRLTGLGIRVGGILAGLSFVYILAILLGGHLKVPLKHESLERVYLEQSLSIAVRALVFATGAVVASLIIRFPQEEATGKFLSLAGGMLYFGGPPFVAWTMQGRIADGNLLGLDILSAIRAAGGIAMFPGLVLVVRDAILRVWTGATTRKMIVRKTYKTPVLSRIKLWESCWDMEFCRDFVRRICPAFAEKKPCWRIKIGCYCDERTILKAMTQDSTDNVHAQGIIKTLKLDQPVKDPLTSKLKRQRCRHCVIYAEHQREKYRFSSPLVFPAVAMVMYAYYNPLREFISQILTRTDRFLSFLVYKSGNTNSYISSDIEVLTTVAIVWLAITTISYSLRTLENLIFELQV